jgi:hypothetical protein
MAATPSKTIAEVPDFHPYGWVANPCATRPEVRRNTIGDFPGHAKSRKLMARHRAVWVSAGAAGAKAQTKAYLM